jgi:predicted Zn-dependent peptidase
MVKDSILPPMPTLSAPPRLHQPVLHRLANGCTIIAEQLPVDAVTLDVWVRVGSAIEPDVINGMAHFLEHMIFKGSAQLACGEFERRVEAQGALSNAATSQDYTHYYLTCAPQDFASLAPLQLDVVLHPQLPAEEFERERRVVLEEIRRAEDNPRRRAYFHLLEASFDRLPYRRPVLGPSSVVKRLQPRQMRAFHKQWYTPENLIVVVVGNLPVEVLIGTVEAQLAQTRAIAPQRSRLIPEEPFQEMRRLVHRDAQLQQARLYLSWRVPGLDDSRPTQCLDMIAALLSSGRTARLVRDLREEKGWVSSISVSNSSYRHQGLFTISARLPNDSIERVEATIVEHLQRLAEGSIPLAELDRIRAQVASRFVFGSERPADRAALYGYYQSLLGELSPALDYPQLIRELQPRDIQQAVQEHLSVQAYTSVTLLPEAA